MTPGEELPGVDWDAKNSVAVQRSTEASRRKPRAQASDTERRLAGALRGASAALGDAYLTLAAQRGLTRARIHAWCEALDAASVALKEMVNG